MSNKITVVGLDPSMNNFGIVIAKLDLETLELSDLNLVLSQPNHELGKTVRVNSKDLATAKQHWETLQELIPDNALVFAEIPVGSQSSRAMASYGMCIGLIASIPNTVIQVTPTEVKLAAVGNKTATKAEMIQWATNKYLSANWLTTKRKGVESFTDKNEHLADAVAAIHAGLNTHEFKTARQLKLK